MRVQNKNTYRFDGYFVMYRLVELSKEATRKTDRYKINHNPMPTAFT